MAVCDDTTVTCSKGDRARTYCRRTPCLNHASLMSAVDLPQPQVDVTVADAPAIEGQTVSGKQVDVVLSRDGKARSYTIVGATEAERTKDVVEKILDDHRNAEFVRHR